MKHILEKTVYVVTDVAMLLMLLALGYYILKVLGVVKFVAGTTGV